MNRLVLIGNGFDLAHDLKTRYEDFIYWYWKRRITGLYNIRSTTSGDTLCDLEIIGTEWHTYYYQHSIDINNSDGKTLYQHLVKHKNKFTIHPTPFFGSILKSLETKGWVDIENEYYNLLEFYSLKQYSPKNIEELNKQLQYLQELLTEYLTTINQQDIPIKDSIKKKIYAPIDKNDISVEAKSILNDYIDWCNKQDESLWKSQLNRYYKDFSFISGELSDIEDFKRNPIGFQRYPDAYMLPRRIMLLDFNYTKTVRGYLRQEFDIFSHIQIHGHLETPETMIFGYGDEFEDKYKKLQNLNDNECLTNIKTIRYQESDNYRRVLSFIESAPFQICIMGHSCGNSDRTLLNTLFEHKNCISIKPYFYIKEDGTDNYIEIVQNISRNFTDMKLMRDRVVNRNFTKALTQQ